MGGFKTDYVIENYVTFFLRRALKQSYLNRIFSIEWLVTTFVDHSNNLRGGGHFASIRKIRFY